MLAEPKAPADAHEWVSFEDPSEERTWLMDVTFLSSAWQCIYGAGCQGVLTAPAPERMEGCCSYGAHFTDEADAQRVAAAAETLTEQQWQFRAKGRRKGGVLKRDSKGVITTRLVAGACIFLNRPSHAGGAGCALHRAALERGVPPLELKPDVCWQLPLRREDTVATDGHVTSSLGEWARRHWGEGGQEFAWWCTEAPEAFSGAEPVYVSLRDEIVAMAGQDVYDLLAAYLDSRARRRARGTALLAHPTVRKRAGTGANRAV
ncbi:MAG: hypothetical protein ABSD85_08295 [Acidimicrobiales bacterium]|jgi:hypothetical protein